MILNHIEEEAGLTVLQSMPVSYKSDKLLQFKMHHVLSGT